MVNKIFGSIKAMFGIKIRLWVLLLLCTVSVGSGFLISQSSTEQRFGGEEAYAEAQKYLEVKSVIEQNYIGDADAAEMADAAAAAMVTSIGDEWSYYMDAAEYEAYLLYSANSYVSIGMTIESTTDNSGYVVNSVTSNSPAERGGVLKGDIIVSVGGTDVRSMELEELRSMLRTLLDETVTIEVMREGQEYSLTVDGSVTYSSPVSYELMNYDVGYVRIENFEDGAGAAATAAVEELMLQGAVALVFDLRSNPGGFLTELIEILDYLLPAGDLFISVDEHGEETIMTSDNVCIELPMAVIVNGNSYSAAEYFAAAMSEYGWATIVGEATTGKGRSQITIPLSDGSAIHISNSKYLTPNRVDLAEQGGIVPDVVVEESEINDDQLDAAIALVA